MLRFFLFVVLVLVACWRILFLLCLSSSLFSASAKSYRYSRILFICAPVVAADVDVVSAAAAAAVETKQRTVPASGLTTPTHTLAQVKKISHLIILLHALSFSLSLTPLLPLLSAKIFVNKFDYVFSYIYCIRVCARFIYLTCSALQLAKRRNMSTHTLADAHKQKQTSLSK